MIADAAKKLKYCDNDYRVLEEAYREMREELISAERTLLRMTKAYKKLVWNWDAMKAENKELRAQLRKFERNG